MVEKLTGGLTRTERGWIEHVELAGAALASGAVITATLAVSVASFVLDSFSDA